MGTLYLVCALCGRRQAGGLLSSAAWKRLDDSGAKLACPTCADGNPKWGEQVGPSAQQAAG